MGLTKLKQYIRFQFNISVNTINGVVVENGDILQVVWKTGTHKGKLKTHTLKLDHAVSQTQTINLWWQQHIIFDASLCMDVEAQSFDATPICFQLKREKNEMIEVLGEFKTDLGLCANTVLTESEFSVDVTSKNFDQLKANIIVKFKLIEKSPIREMQNVVSHMDSAGLASSIQELRQEMSRVANDYSVLKSLVLDSQSFSKSDYWVEKLPDMELNLKEYKIKVDELNAYVKKLVKDTKITVMDDKITDLQAKFFTEQDKLRRLSDIHQAFTQTTANEFTKIRERGDSSGRSTPSSFTGLGLSSFGPSGSLGPSSGAGVLGGAFAGGANAGRGEQVGTWSHPPRSKHLSLHMINFDRNNTRSPTPVSPSNKYTDTLELSSTEITPLTSPDLTPAASLSRGSNIAKMLAQAEIQTRFAQLEEFQMRLERMEAENELMTPRLSIDEADIQQLHLTAEALKWEREKDMENFYLFQKSQTQTAEELSKLKLQINELNVHPRKLEQRIELLEVHMGKVKKAFAGMKIGGGTASESHPSSGPVPLGIDSQPRSENPLNTPQPSYAAQGSAALTPAYHWFLLDHCFLFVSDAEPAGDLLVPAYFLVRFCSDNLDLAICKEDWSVFDGLFFALHFETKKHIKSPTHLLFWLSNTSFILEQLKQNVFSSFGSQKMIPSIAENVQVVNRELENFIKNIYRTLAAFFSQVFEAAVKSFAFSNAGDNENEWVTSILAKLDWLETMLKSYRLTASFIQSVLGDMYAVMDTTLFNLICTDSSLCTPARANQMKFFISALDNWACSDHPSNSQIIDQLCHVREMSNLILGPKANLRDSSFRKSLFPHLSDLQHKHLLTIFTPDSASEKLPPTLLSDLSAQITYTPGQGDLDYQAIFTTHQLGDFFENRLPSSETAARGGRFSPPISDTSSNSQGYAVVDTSMAEVHDVLASDEYAHWVYLSRELQKWGRSKYAFIPAKGSSQVEGSFVELAPEVITGIQELISQCAN